MPTDPYAIPQVALNNLQRVGPVISPLQGLREIVQSYAAINRMALANSRARGGGRGGGWSGVPGEYSGVGNPSKGRWVELPNGEKKWAPGTDKKERDQSEAQIKSEYARKVLSKDEKYKELTKDFDKLSLPGKREKMQKVREHMAEIAPALGMNPQQSVMLGTAGMAENIAAREKAIKDVGFFDTLFSELGRGATDVYRAITTIGATPQEKQAAARASNQEAQEAAANNAYIDEMNRRSAEGRSTLGMRLRPTGLAVTLGESLPGLGGTIAAQGLMGAAGGLIGGLVGGPAGAAAGSTLGQTVGRFAGAAAGGAAAAGPLSEYSNVRRIEASDMSDADKLAAIEKSNAGLYGAVVGAIPLGPAAGAGMALRQIPRTAPYVGRLSKLAAPAQTYTGGVVKGLVPNAIDAATLGAGFNIAGNLAYNNATGQAIPLTEGLGEAIMEGAILGLPMAFMGARGSAGRYNAWDTRNTARETNIANRQAVDTINRQISEAAPNQPRMLNENINLRTLTTPHDSIEYALRQMTGNTASAARSNALNNISPIITALSEPGRISSPVVSVAPETKPLVLGPQNFEANTPVPIPKTLNENPLTNAERNALRSVKQQDVFFTQLSNLLGTRTPEAQQKVFADIGKSGKFTPQQKDWADTYRRLYLGKQSAESGGVEQAAGLGRNEQRGEGNLNPADNNTGSAAATNTEGITPTTPNKPASEITPGDTAAKAGGDDGTRPSDTRQNKTPEGTPVEQGAGGTKTANGEPGAIPTTPVSPKPGESAGGGEPPASTGERRVTDAATAGEQPVTPNEKSLEVIDELTNRAIAEESFNETRAEIGNTPVSNELVDFTSKQVYDAITANKSAGRYIKDESDAMNRAYDIYSKLASGIPLKDLSKTEQLQYKALRDNGLPDYKDAVPEGVVEYSRQQLEKGEDILHLLATPGEKKIVDYIKSNLMNKYNRDHNAENPFKNVCWGR